MEQSFLSKETAQWHDRARPQGSRLWHNNPHTTVLSLWYAFLFRTDLYSEEPIALCDAKFEQAAVLHNLGESNLNFIQEKNVTWKKFLNYATPIGTVTVSRALQNDCGKKFYIAVLLQTASEKKILL